MNNRAKNLEELKELAKTFFVETKQMFKSCKCAYMNIDDNGLRSCYGDFGRRSDAREAISMWAMAFYALGGKVKAEIINGNYRISVNF